MQLDSKMYLQDDNIMKSVLFLQQIIMCEISSPLIEDTLMQ